MAKAPRKKNDQAKMRAALFASEPLAYFYRRLPYATMLAKVEKERERNDAIIRAYTKRETEKKERKQKAKEAAMEADLHFYAAQQRKRAEALEKRREDALRAHDERLRGRETAMKAAEEKRERIRARNRRIAAKMAHDKRLQARQLTRLLTSS